ncbi:MAG: sporulation protein YqfD [Clostridia bacterium]|nr:sporulation protein YqfD [Clostridia bacterium]
MRSLFWLRFLRGGVRFSAAGGFCERFINLCHVRGIRVHDLHMQANALSGCVGCRDYRRLRLIARQSGMVLHAEEKIGLPFFLHRHEKRRMLPIAGGVCFVLLWLLSGCIWSVDVAGGSAVPREAMLAVMAENGLRPGVWRKRVNSAALTQAAMNAFNGKLAWAAVNIDASRVVIETRDYIPPDADETYGDPCNLVADFDGLLLSIEVHSGKKANQEGNGVKQGDLLISGVTENRYGKQFFYEARGIVTAIHSDVVTLTRPLRHSTLPIQKTTRRFKLQCLHVALPPGRLKANDRSSLFQRDRQLCSGNVSLPLTLTETTRASYGSPTPTDEAVGAALLFDDFTALCHRRYGNTTLLSQTLRVVQTGDSLTVRQKARCIDFMGTPQKIQRTGDGT